MGTLVRAAADGIIVHADWEGGYGRLIIVDHGNEVQTYYGHSRAHVVPGQEVRRGDVIGRSGASAASPLRICIMKCGWATCR